MQAAALLALRGDALPVVRAFLDDDRWIVTIAAANRAFQELLEGERAVTIQLFVVWQDYLHEKEQERILEARVGLWADQGVELGNHRQALEEVGYVDSD